MTYKIKLKEGNEIKDVNITKVINDYERLIYKICIRWINSFNFDRSIEIEDLVQELRIKYLCDLKNYDYREGSLMPYMSRIAINFFINKRKKIISNDCYPIGVNGNILYLISTSKELNGDTDATVEDTLKSDKDQYKEYYYEELINIVRDKLNGKKYKPNDYVVTSRSFTLVIFDLLFYGNESFIDFIQFQHRCRIRKAKCRQGSKVPKIITPTTKMIGDYLEVDKRTINSAYNIIKDTIKNIGE